MGVGFEGNNDEKDEKEEEDGLSSATAPFCSSDQDRRSPMKELKLQRRYRKREFGQGR